MFLYSLDPKGLTRVSWDKHLQDPYHGPGQAMGLSFSVPEGIKIPSSLVNIFKEIKNDVGCPIPKHGNLEKWAYQVRSILRCLVKVVQLYKSINISPLLRVRQCMTSHFSAYFFCVLQKVLMT